MARHSDHSPPRIEREFGVPIPGEILDPELWTRTAIKKLPEEKPVDFAAIFGRKAPVVLDLGCGNGRFTLGSALTRRDVDHLAVDILPVVIRYATRRGNQRGLSNVRFAVIGGLELLKGYIPPASVSEIHCYHPQPYYDQNDVHKRLITPEFLALAYRALVPGGLLVLQTDHP
ncbi:MAG: methyltransferase domain-containing protein, partial [Planctomycetaceae bacterium]